ncbi:GTP-binding protein [Leucoagaricus gongylophorus]
MPTTDFLKKERIVVFSRCVVLFLLDVSFPYLDTRKANPPSFFNTLRTNSDEFSLVNANHTIGTHGYIIVYSVASRNSL